MHNKNGILYAVLAILVIGSVVYAVVSRPEMNSGEDLNTNEAVNEGSTPSTDTNSASTKPSTTTPKKPVVTAPDDSEPNFYITIDNSNGPVDPDTYQIKMGKHVVMRVTTGTNDTLMIKGLDKSVALKAGVQGTLEFDADTLGLYEISLVSQGAFLGQVEVIPDTK